MSVNTKKIKDVLSSKKTGDDLTFEKDKDAQNIVKAIAIRDGHQRVVRLFVISEEDFDRISIEPPSVVISEISNGKVMSR